ncbi:class I SAM-dependent methyltransferase [Hydrogenophaga sp.]|uniref:class I SAM-dependent methyltransferase n=1 Tax=Hydrogenophaga sp. TaxID=1904254 RepID=UPI003D0C765F
MMAIHPRPLIGLAYLPRFFRHWVRFNKLHQGDRLKVADAYPNLYDWVASTPFDPHYFYQAAWLARQLAGTPPVRHLDIGSDVKLIATLSAFVPTEFMDFRPLDAALTGLECTRGDILALPMEDDSVKSVSCLHVVEHIGLGRYGDPIDPEGSRKAIAELQRVLAPGGRLFLSVPVGRERICFNAHRVFATKTILALLGKLSLVSFSLVDDAGRYWPDCSTDRANDQDYGCGMFVLEKPRNHQSP